MIRGLSMMRAVRFPFSTIPMIHAWWPSPYFGDLISAQKRAACSRGRQISRPPIKKRRSGQSQGSVIMFKCDASECSVLLLLDLDAVVDTDADHIIVALRTFWLMLLSLCRDLSVFLGSSFLWCSSRQHCYMDDTFPQTNYTSCQSYNIVFKDWITQE